jgi:hypothetical protein
MHPTTCPSSPSSLAATPTDIAGPPDADTDPDAWRKLIGLYATAFTRPSFRNFVRLVNGWALYPGRRTVTNMITLADPEGNHAHDAYHRLIRNGKWEMASLWRTLATLAVERLADLSAPIPLDLDDTLYGKVGGKVEGAGIFRDPVRSTVHRTVYARGLNLVVLTLRVQPPWGGGPIGLPINLRLYRKGGKSQGGRAGRCTVPRWWARRSGIGARLAVGARGEILVRRLSSGPAAARSRECEPGCRHLLMSIVSIASVGHKT